MCVCDSSCERDTRLTQPIQKAVIRPSCALMKAKHSCMYMREACEIHCCKPIQFLRRRLQRGDLAQERRRGVLCHSGVAPSSAGLKPSKLT